MAKASKKTAKGPSKEGLKILATNPNARRNYFIEDTLEAGMVLTGTEIKSMRAQSPNLKDAYVEIKGDARSPHAEAYLLSAHVAPYQYGNIWNHDPLRPRKLLLHRQQISRLIGAITRKGYTIVPTRIYLKKGRAKIEIGFAKGKKIHDKREANKTRSDERSMAQALKRGKS